MFQSKVCGLQCSVSLKYLLYPLPAHTPPKNCSCSIKETTKEGKSEDVSNTVLLHRESEECVRYYCNTHWYAIENDAKSDLLSFHR